MISTLPSVWLQKSLILKTLVKLVLSVHHECTKYCRKHTAHKQGAYLNELISPVVLIFFFRKIKIQTTFNMLLWWCIVKPDQETKGTKPSVNAFTPVWRIRNKISCIITLTFTVCWMWITFNMQVVNYCSVWKL